ncbi:MAG: DUF5610 domain-containing protein [Fibrobacter sp.]|nr:DUF5610 domain-containing protein [Fibrobacter sp.]
MIPSVRANSITPFAETKVDTKNRKSESDNFSVKSNSASYSSQSLNFKYTSKDGDTVSLNYESREYTEKSTSVEGNTEKNSENVENVSRYVSEQITKMKKTQINQILKDMGFIISETDETKAGEKSGVVDDYWNAENTSQRIVDFAVSFFGSFKGSSEEYLETIKDAISKGFSQAKEMLGELPDSVTELTNSTYDLVMEKLDTWFAGIKSSDSGEQETKNEQVA